jgi:hypothetical protein
MAERGLDVDHSTIGRAGGGGRVRVGYSVTLLSFTSEFVGTPGLQTAPGGSMKHTSVLLDAGPIYIGRSIPAASQNLWFPSLRQIQEKSDSA